MVNPGRTHPYEPAADGDDGADQSGGGEAV